MSRGLPATRSTANARARPDNASAPGVSPAAVLQADRRTQSALSFSSATSLAVSLPKRGLSGLLEAVRAKGGVLDLSQRKLARQIGASRTSWRRPRRIRRQQLAR